MSELVYTRTCVALPTQYDIGEVGSLRAWYFRWRHGSWQLHAYPLTQESWANPLATGTSEADAEMDLSEVRQIVEGVLWGADVLFCTCVVARSRGEGSVSKDCPRHGREAQDWEAQEARANRNLDMMMDGLDSPADLEDHSDAEEEQ